ncbi:MAG: CotS family spore coat protein [Firmicutes bacterium]|nr:CotS family spore coat protein [Bacillota bacterium]
MKKPIQSPKIVVSAYLQEALLNEYGLRVIEARPVKSVWQLNTETGLYCLKVVTHRRKRLKFVLGAMEYLVKSGFHELARLVPTRDGRLFTKVRHHIIFLTEWVEGHKCEFARPADLAAAATTLANFHRHARGYSPPEDSQYKVMWGKWPAILQARWESLTQYKEIAWAKPIKTEFDQLFLTHYAYYHRQAELAVRLLEQSPYAQLVEEGARAQSFIHQDVAGRNFIIAPSGTALLIDFDLVRYDLRVLDLLRLVERTMKKCHWDIKMANLALSRYQSVSRLTPAEWEVLLAFLLFPQKFWRIANRYYTKLDEYSPKQLLQKLEKIISRQDRRHQFLHSFAWLYCQRWLD